jgi:sugar (pentulose or hexulose) kinase
LVLASAMTVMGVAYARIVRPIAALAKAAAGAVAFVGGAAATDFVNTMLQDTGGSVLVSAIEEGLELVGVTLVVWAVLEVVAAEPGAVPRGRPRSRAETVPRATCPHLARHVSVRLGPAPSMVSQP